MRRGHGDVAMRILLRPRQVQPRPVVRSIGRGSHVTFWMLFCRRGVASCVFNGALFVLASCGPHHFRDQPIAWTECRRPVRRVLAARHPSRWGLTFQRRFTGFWDRWLSLEDSAPSGDVNALDFVPDSTWFVSSVGLGRDVESYGGPYRRDRRLDVGNLDGGPSIFGPWRLVAQGSWRVMEWALVGDLLGHQFVLTRPRHGPFGSDPIRVAYPVVASRLLWAAGYWVPRTYMVFVDPGRIRGSSIVSRCPNHRPPVSLNWQPRGCRTEPDAGRMGTWLRFAGPAVAIRLQAGRALGPFALTGTRPGDPSDRLAHDQRRSLRGLRMIAAWLDLTGLDEFSGVDLIRGGLVTHFLWFVGMAGWHAGHSGVRVGRGGRGGFSPSAWRPRMRHPAFESATPQDLFWAGRILAGFDVATISRAVEACFLKQHVASRLVHRLVRRARLAARWGLSHSAPLVRFSIEERAHVRRPGQGRIVRFCFVDLWSRMGFSSTRHHYDVRIMDGRGRRVGRAQWAGKGSRVCGTLDLKGYRYSILSVARRGGPGGHVRVHVVSSGRGMRIVGIER